MPKIKQNPVQIQQKWSIFAASTTIAMTKVLKHIVMWKFLDEAEGRTRQENAQWMKDHLEALVGQIPELLSAEVGINCKDSDAAYDAVLTATFHSFEAMERYKNHPLHQQISQYCKKVRKDRVACDYFIES